MSDLSVGDSRLGVDAAALELRCGALGSQQGSQTSLGPAVGDSLDLLALDASIRSVSSDVARARLSPAVPSPEVTAPSLRGSPPAASSVSGEVALLSRSSSAVSVHSGTADLDVIGPDAVACGSPRAAADSLCAFLTWISTRCLSVSGEVEMLSRSSSAVSVRSGKLTSTR